jgi:hypothetical protein
VGEVLLIKDPSHFAIGSGRLYVVTAAVVGDREHPGHFAIDSGRLDVVTAAVGGDREGFEGEVGRRGAAASRGLADVQVDLPSA